MAHSWNQSDLSMEAECDYCSQIFLMTERPASPSTN